MRYTVEPYLLGRLLWGSLRWVSNCQCEAMLDSWRQAIEARTQATASNATGPRSAG
jgi:hypothetical protein